MSVPLPSAPRVTLAPNVFLQPPLSRRGIGPGLVLFLPDISFSPGVTKPLDPEPILKWAEEGFAVVGIVNSEGLNVQKALTQGVNALSELSQVDIKDKFAVIDVVSMDSRFVAFVGYGSFPSSSCRTPALLHLPSASSKPRDKSVPTAGSITQYSYSTDSPNFVLPQSPSYTPGNASVAHSRTLSFLRQHLGGPFFDLEATGDDQMNLYAILRTTKPLTGSFRVCLQPEKSYLFQWSALLMSAETVSTMHIWWDQAAVLRQAGILPTYVPFPLLDDSDAPPPLGEGHRQLLRLPVAGAECAAKLVNETKEKSNGVFGSNWGLQAHPRN